MNEFNNFERETGVKLMIVKARGKAFCVGGDVVEFCRLVMAGKWDIGMDVYRKQNILGYRVATCDKPQVFLINGLVMGGGVGISIHGKFRIVTENTIFSMPEATLGLFPDVGASYFLSRLPGFFGEYVGLTGARLDGPEMLSCGLATHFVPSRKLSMLEKSLCEVDTVDLITVEGIINKYAEQAPFTKERSALRRLDMINKCFSKDTVEEILSSLEHDATIRKEEWIMRAITSIKAASPLSLKLFLMSDRSIRNTCTMLNSRIQNDLSCRKENNI
ncbi:3-hydroxyisobutyryl-CoA hydrolase 1 isoform D [Canna indica]|uniref:3-hydroxyisobutyryl-CoA hydrolase n=1 Tax=Canna indica TaxID=4628 RepID=A0AAQ3KCQ7_9LILI|nr:3-hydroxyisobutyryl-CoA hydrolase 1 isoform D [Canna indica]